MPTIQTDNPAVTAAMFDNLPTQLVAMPEWAGWAIVGVAVWLLCCIVRVHIERHEAEERARQHNVAMARMNWDRQRREAAHKARLAAQGTTDHWLSGQKRKG